MKKAKVPYTSVEWALLGAAEFMGRMMTDNPPNEFDRATKLAAISKVLLDAHPHLSKDTYYGQFLSRDILLGGRR